MSEQVDTGGIDYTVLDWFAGQALAQPHDWDQIRSLAQQHRCSAYQILAAMCYDQAAAMIAEKRGRESAGKKEVGE